MGIKTPSTTASSANKNAFFMVLSLLFWDSWSEIALISKLSSIDIKKVATEVTEDLDFKKLNVGKLRELVVTRSLTDKAGAKKMKKKQLVELLS